MNTQPEALRLADVLEDQVDVDGHWSRTMIDIAAVMLRQQDKLIQNLVKSMQPFVLTNSSEDFVILVVRSEDITNARAAIAKAEGKTK